MSLHGIINVNKPIGITSAQTLYRVRTICRQKKSGHAGALDRLATGVLLLCFGRATKLVEAIMDQPKVYRATARLDVTSLSLDSGEPFECVTVNQIPHPEQVREALTTFVGQIEQIPPLISALKINGVPAHRKARKNQKLELRARPIRIYWIAIHAFDWPTLDFEVCCSRGTYIRALIRDIGKQLGTGGCLTSLSRTQVGHFSLEDAWDLDALPLAESPSKCLLDVEEARMLLDPQRIAIPPAPKNALDAPATT